MEKIHLIMPMAGGGTRFGQMGYEIPKPLIKLQGKPFFYWSVQSIVKNIDIYDITFIVLKEHVEGFQIDKKIKNYYPESNIVIIPHVLNGAVLTSMKGVEVIDDNFPLLFNDCDHAFRCSSFEKYCREDESIHPDGALLTFYSTEDKYSYAILGPKGEVCGTVEKKVVSEAAICGAYYFKNKEIFMESASKYLKQCAYKEFFMSGVYNIMHKDNQLLNHFMVDWHLSFGTPMEYKEAGNSNLLQELI